jgi:hypothetical protein
MMVIVLIHCQQTFFHFDGRLGGVGTGVGGGTVGGGTAGGGVGGGLKCFSNR